MWNVPARNVSFTGREDLLTGLRTSLHTGWAMMVQTLQGFPAWPHLQQDR